jgi:hypothetical protein
MRSRRAASDADARPVGLPVAAAADVCPLALTLAILADEPSETFGIFCVTPRQREHPAA